MAISGSNISLPPALTIGQLKTMGWLGRTSLAFAIAALGLLLWLMFANNPLGGEPHITLTIDGSEKAAEISGDTTNLNMRESLRPEDKTQMAANIDEQDVTGDARKKIPSEINDDSGRKNSNKSKALRPKGTLKALVEKTTSGSLPRIGPNGQKPSLAYARKLSPRTARSRKARIAIFIGGMGLSGSGTTQAITKLPGAVTLAFAPYAKGLNNWRAQAQQNGHEVMLQIPMEPFDYPDNDPGPYTLLNRLSVHKNILRLKWLMGRFTGYFGVTNYMGAKFTASADTLRPILEELNNRGLVFVDDGSSVRSRSKAVSQQVGIGHAKANIVIDAEHSRTAIMANLKRLEKLAVERGMAIGVGSGLPVTIKSIAQWAKTLNKKGIILVPVSATIPRAARQARK